MFRAKSGTRDATLAKAYKSPFGAPHPVPFAKPLILCVDNDSVHLHLRKAILEKDGYNVIGVTNERDALAAFREAPVCCAISDHLLGGKAGTELARKMKNIKPDVPVILYSGTMPQNLQGIDVYINKDEPTAEFLKIVREVVLRFCS